MAGDLEVVVPDQAKRAFAAALTACAIATRHELSGPEIEVYARALNDLPWSALMAAFTRAAKECEFFPSVATLRAMAEEGLGGAVPDAAATQALLESHGHPELARPGDGVWKTHTTKLGTIWMKVLPDDHPALPRYHCVRCQDSGWATTTQRAFGQVFDAVLRCPCLPVNPVIARRRERDAAWRTERASRAKGGSR